MCKQPLLALALLAFLPLPILAEEPDQVLLPWNDAKPPGETSLSRGEAIPPRPTEKPPAMRIGKITQPTLEVFAPAVDKRTGAAVLIFPGGAYNYCVTDKEGSEPARWLNGQGITAFVLKYRTKNGSTEAPWKRPLQDAQRSVSLVRARTAEWGLKPDRIGVMGFSAGGQLAVLTATRFDERSYEPVDDIEKTSCRPDFALLIYPWNLYDPKAEKLIPELTLSDKLPPTFLLHTHDDGSSSLGPVLFYAALKQRKIPAELHVYQAGGHGYGMRPVAGTTIHTWPDRAAAWLQLQNAASN
jgi:acetyl esterase/lipase